MITVNMHEAKSRLSELVKAVETEGEIVILQRNGVPVAEIRGLSSAAPFDRTRIAPDPTLYVETVLGFDPGEPLSEDEWPAKLR
jgi:prevent-host-death family protein